MNSILLKNGLCLSRGVLERSDVRISEGSIAERCSSLTARAGEGVEDLDGRILMPGLICAHTHLYSTLARGMPSPGPPPRNFLEILQNVWWKLDRALDSEMVYLSALAGAVEAARCGVTTVIDHHASPNCIGGSLLQVKRGLAEVGLRGILCYETSDRDGAERRDQGLAENEDFLKAHGTDAMFRGLAGGHASFTLSDESLRRLGDIAERYGTGVHIHLAEADADVEITREKFGRSILSRFEDFGILCTTSLLAHCVHLTPREFEKLRSSGAWLVHNPRSNMNNRVGRAVLGEFGPRRVLGTDGFPPDMFEELRAAHFCSREAGMEGSTDPVDLPGNGQQLVSEIFQKPFGVLQTGAPADLVVLEYRSPTPVTADNLAAHMVFGFRSSMVESVMVDGKWVLHGRMFPALDEDEVLQRAWDAARKLWSVMHGIG